MMTNPDDLDYKKPGDEKDYGVDFEPQIADAAVTIVTSDWAIITPLGSPDLQLGTDSIVGQKTIVRVSGGEAGRDYVLENTIVTSAGETLVEAIEVRVKTATYAAGII
jgi:hypothetical protein